VVCGIWRLLLVYSKGLSGSTGVSHHSCCPCVPRVLASVFQVRVANFSDFTALYVVSRWQTTIFTGPYSLQHRRLSDNTRAKKRSRHRFG